MTKKRQLNIMVCVTSQRSCDKLIARGIERAGAGDPRRFARGTLRGNGAQLYEHTV